MARKKSKQYYTVFVFGDVDPSLYGPFDTDTARDAKAKELRTEEGPDAGGLYWLNIDARGRPAIGSYSGAFFDDEY